MVRYEPYCFLRGRFHYGSLWTLLLPKWRFTMVRYEPYCSLKGDFTVVHYEPYCSHSWNHTKGRFYCGSLWILLLPKGRFHCGSLWTLLLPLLESYQGEILLSQLEPNVGELWFRGTQAQSLNERKVLSPESLWILMLPLLESYQGELLLLTWYTASIFFK